MLMFPNVMIRLTIDCMKVIGVPFAGRVTDALALSRFSCVHPYFGTGLGEDWDK